MIEDNFGIPILPELIGKTEMGCAWNEYDETNNEILTLRKTVTTETKANLKKKY
jgi:hypothetical protein